MEVNHLSNDTMDQNDNELVEILNLDIVENNQLENTLIHTYENETYRQLIVLNLLFQLGQKIMIFHKNLSLFLREPTVQLV